MSHPADLSSVYLESIGYSQEVFTPELTLMFYSGSEQSCELDGKIDKVMSETIMEYLNEDLEKRLEKERNYV